MKMALHLTLCLTVCNLTSDRFQGLGISGRVSPAHRIEYFAYVKHQVDTH